MDDLELHHEFALFVVNETTHRKFNEIDYFTLDNDTSKSYDIKQLFTAWFNYEIRKPELLK